MTKRVKLGLLVGSLLLLGAIPVLIAGRPDASSVSKQTVPALVRNAEAPSGNPTLLAGVPESADSPADSPRRRPFSFLPILMYHVIGDGPNNLFVPVADFRAQMEYLERSGYHAVTMQQVYESLVRGAPLPSRPVAITFDDGYISQFTQAFRILQEHHFTGTFYLVTGLMGHQGYLSGAQAIEMDRAGMEIDAHTQNHLDLTTLSSERLTAEVAGSKRALETLLGHAVTGFCYPSGRYSAPVVKAVQAAGYQHATTTEAGFVGPGSDALRLPRVRVSKGESLQAFIRSLHP